MQLKRISLITPSWKALAILVLLALVIAVLLLGRAAAAPNSGYSLDWWTVDAGGGSSAGGGYSLSGGVAQPDVGSISGGNYQLQGGFWHRHCAPVAVQVDITCQGNQAQLAWTPDEANMAYDIYRDTHPYFDPDPTTRVGTDTDGVWFDTPNTCGDVSTNYYYQVRATCIGGHADTNHCAEFDFAFVPGS